MFVVTRRRTVIIVFTGIIILIGCLALLGNLVLFQWENSEDGKRIDLKLSFLLPVEKESFKISVSTEIPVGKRNELTWVSGRRVNITVRETNLPSGQLHIFEVRARYRYIPFLSVSARRSFIPEVCPEPLEIRPSRGVRTTGPIYLKFNTPVTRESLVRSIFFPMPVKVEPLTRTVNGGQVADYSAWSIFPAEPMEEGRVYTLTLNKGISSIGGTESFSKFNFSFTTAEKPEIIGVYPKRGAEGVLMNESVSVEADREIYGAEITVVNGDREKEVSGRVQIKGKKAIFVPFEMWDPNTKYKIEASVRSKEGEWSKILKAWFKTRDMGNELWVAVNLGKIHTVVIYEGNFPKHLMIASGGKGEGDSITPTGIFRVQDRGLSFWSPRFNEGAYYWVRVKDQILFHSVPKDGNWKTKEEEHRKLGLPASHGCIRLSEEDAKWFYENIPPGTLVIIH